VDCNCSICAMTGFQHLIVPAEHFRLLSDPAALTEYSFGTGVAKHRFCSICGIKSFYVPRSNPDGIDVNVRCLDPSGIRSLTLQPFDGRGDWEGGAEALSHLSRVDD